MQKPPPERYRNTAPTGVSYAKNSALLYVESDEPRQIRRPVPPGRAGSYPQCTRGSATTGGDVAELLILEAQVTNCRCGVTTTNDGECVRVDDSLCHRAGTLSEGSNLEHANGAVPEDGLCSLNLLSEDFAGLGPMSRPSASAPSLPPVRSSMGEPRC